MVTEDHVIPTVKEKWKKCYATLKENEYYNKIR